MTQQKQLSGLTLRPAAWSDLEEVAALILLVCTYDGDPTVAVTPQELKREWQMPRYNLTSDAWVVTDDKDGRIVGYQEFVNRHAHASLNGDGYVHPEYVGRGIGTAILRTLETRARQEIPLAEPDLRVFLRNGMSIGDKAARELHENEGYSPIRFFWRMEIKLDAPPPVPEWPAGIELRPVDLEVHQRDIYLAHEEAFSDHWGHTAHPYDEWLARNVKREGFDPSLWFVAWEGDQIAGYALCRYRMGIGWVGSLGVRRPWRNRGLGLGLLYHAFHEFYLREMRTIGLGVDAGNPTGAIRLYQKAGMQIAAEYVIYEKELRPGRDPEVEPGNGEDG